MQKKIDMYTGLVAAIFGFIVSILALNLPAGFLTGGRQHVFLPLGAGVIMCIAGISLFYINYKKIKKEGLPEQKRDEQKEEHYKLIIATILISIVYAFFFKRLGYILSTTLYLSSMLFLLRGKKKWISNIVIPLGFSYVIIFTFGKFLQIYLPTL
jgi:putative tricarboxylic transport membrane protein